MSARALRNVAIFWTYLIVACPESRAFRAFPIEPDMNANLHRDMTPAEVIAVFGEPSNGRPERCINCRFLYLAPTGLRTVEREGYQGFEIQFAEDKVRSWRVFYGFPSYDATALRPPTSFKLWLIAWPLVFVIGFVIVFVRGIPVIMTQRARMLRAFVKMDIPSTLPPDFTFITHDTTMREIFERAGACTREIEFPVRREELHNYPLIRTKKGAPGIRTLEYELPYGSLIVMPEYPFESESPTRAVYRWQGHKHI